MRSILANYSINNITKKRNIKNDECHFEGISSCSSSLDISENKACLDITNGYAFARPVKVTTLNGNSYEDVYMVVDGCYLIEFPIGFNPSYEAFTVMKSNGGEVAPNMESRVDYYLVTKQNISLYLNNEAEISLNSDKTIQSASAKSNIFYIFNPSYFSAEVEDIGQDWYVTTQEDDPVEQRLTYSNPSITGMQYGTFSLRQVSQIPTGSYAKSVKLNIKGNDLGDFPQIAWKIHTGIFNIDTPDDELPKKLVLPKEDEKGGLSAGAIGGIIFACIVVVGVTAFCIVWFVVLKKPLVCCSYSNI